MEDDMTARSGKSPSHRQLRVAERVRQVLAQLLRDTPLEGGVSGGMVTVSEVRMTNDLRHATVFIHPLGGDGLEEMVRALGKAAPQLRGPVGRAVGMRYAPELHFKPDRSFDEAERIESLLAEARARDADLPGRNDDAGDEEE
jgi:ribosome-binding factor A